MLAELKNKISSSQLFGTPNHSFDSNDGGSLAPPPAPLSAPPLLGPRSGSPNRGRERPLPPTPPQPTAPPPNPPPNPPKLQNPPKPQNSPKPQNLPQPQNLPKPTKFHPVRSRPPLDLPIQAPLSRPLPPTPPIGESTNGGGVNRRNSAHGSSPATTPDFAPPSVLGGDAGMWNLTHWTNAGGANISPSGPPGRDLRNYPWFHPVERRHAEVLLQKTEDGTYLIRESKHGGSNNPLTLSLQFKGRMYHVNIRQRADGRYALGTEKPNELSFSSVAELVETHQQEPLKLHSQGQIMGVTRLEHTVPQRPGINV